MIRKSLIIMKNRFVLSFKFIDYILDAKNSAACFEYLGYYCTTKTADELIADEYKDFLTLPADFDASKTEMIENVSAEISELHDKVFTEFKSLCE